MNDYLLKLIQKYKFKGVLIDANILLSYIVGTVDINLIGRFKRTANFSEDDFYRVSKFIDIFDLKITTPHILTEVSDFIGNRILLQSALGIYVQSTEEKFLESKRIAATETFRRHGLADAAISETAKDSHLIVNGR